MINLILISDINLAEFSIENSIVILACEKITSYMEKVCDYVVLVDNMDETHIMYTLLNFIYEKKLHYDMLIRLYNTDTVLYQNINSIVYNKSFISIPLKYVKTVRELLLYDNIDSIQNLL